MRTFQIYAKTVWSHLLQIRAFSVHEVRRIALRATTASNVLQLDSSPATQVPNSLNKYRTRPADRLCSKKSCTKIRRDIGERQNNIPCMFWPLRKTTISNALFPSTSLTSGPHLRPSRGVIDRQNNGDTPDRIPIFQSLS